MPLVNPRRRTRRRMALACLVTVPLLAGLTIAGSELAQQGFLDWTSTAQHEQQAACAAGRTPPFGRCPGEPDSNQRPISDR